MSDNKYPYIGDNGNCQIVLIYGKGSAFHIAGKYEGEFSNNYNEAGVKNIAREYLVNTYGKCESQEHADFICKLSENAGFRAFGDYNEENQWFCFNNYRVDFYSEDVAKDDNEKLIHLPLPPKENEMESQLPEINVKTEMPEVKPEKPIYTKEMHECGLSPKVGMECLITYKGGNTFKGKIKYISKYGFVYEREDGKDSFNGSIDIVEFKPIPTIEDELSNEIANYITQPKSIDCSELADLLLTKYNITPKDQH